MRKKLEIQTILVLLCLLVIAAALIGTQVAKDSFGLRSEPAELHFTTPDLLGLVQGSELYCAGALIGHVRKIVPSLGPGGAARFLLVSGVKKDFADWKFSPEGSVRPGVVVSAFSPSSIIMELSSDPQAVRPLHPNEGPAPVLPLEPEVSENDLAKIAERVNKLTENIDLAIRQFTEPQNGRSLSVVQELAEAVPAAAASLRNVESVTASLEKQMSAEGKIDQTLTSLNSGLASVENLTNEAAKTLGDLSRELDASMARVNVLLDETTGTMAAVHGKVDGFGGTFIGRMIIAKPEAVPKPSPTPKKAR